MRLSQSLFNILEITFFLNYENYIVNNMNMIIAVKIFLYILNLTCEPQKIAHARPPQAQYTETK